MEVKASLRNLRMAPRKVRLVADLVRGKNLADARLQLKFNQSRASKPMLKLIESCVANAQHNFQIDSKTLRIKELVVDQGPMLKRYMARAFGRGASIQKRMSHVRLILDGQVAAGATKKGAVKKEDGKIKGADSANPADMEKQKPVKKEANGVKKAETKKPESVDPRMQGKEHKSRQKTHKESK